MKTKEDLLIESVQALEKIEIVSPKVSKKYVPIYTSEIVKSLAPEFKFMGGRQFVKGLSKHYVDLVNKDGDTIRIYNSYDRTLALRVNLVTADGLGIDLGIDRLIHIGTKAKEFSDEISEAKQDILDSIPRAHATLAHLQRTPISVELAKEISDTIFKYEIVMKGFESYTNYVDILIENEISVKRYIEMSIKNFFEGEYTYTVQGKKRNGRITKSLLRKVRLENEVMSVVQEKFPEYFL